MKIDNISQETFFRLHDAGTQHLHRDRGIRQFVYRYNFNSRLPYLVCTLTLFNPAISSIAHLYLSHTGPCCVQQVAVTFLAALYGKNQGALRKFWKFIASALTQNHTA